MPELDDLDPPQVRQRSDYVILADASPEGEAIGTALRGRGIEIVNVPIPQLELRIILDAPRVVIVDIEQPGAIEVFERLFQRPSGITTTVLLLGDPVRSADLDPRLFGQVFERPVDIDELAESVAAVLDPRWAQKSREAALRPSFAPPRFTGYPAPLDSDFPSTTDLSSDLEALEGGSVMPSTDEVGSIAPRFMPARISPELEELLTSAEQRITAKAQPSIVPSAEEDVDLILSPELLSALDEPIEPDEDESRGGSTTGGTPMRPAPGSRLSTGAGLGGSGGSPSADRSGRGDLTGPGDPIGMLSEPGDSHYPQAQEVAPTAKRSGSDSLEGAPPPSVREPSGPSPTASSLGELDSQPFAPRGDFTHKRGDGVPDSWTAAGALERVPQHLAALSRAGPAIAPPPPAAADDARDRGSMLRRGVERDPAPAATRGAQRQRDPVPPVRTELARPRAKAPRDDPGRTRPPPARQEQERGQAESISGEAPPREAAEIELRGSRGDEMDEHDRYAALPPPRTREPLDARNARDARENSSPDHPLPSPFLGGRGFTAPAPHVAELRPGAPPLGASRQSAAAFPPPSVHGPVNTPFSTAPAPAPSLSALIDSPPLSAPALAQGRALPPSGPLASDDAPPAVVSTATVLGPGDAPRMLARAVGSRSSGSLALTTEEGVRRIVLHDGDLVTAGSGIPEETLLAFLAARGDIERDTAARLGGKLPASGRHAGAALIAHGHLGQDDLWPVLRAHAEWIIGHVVLIDSGTSDLELEPPGRLKAEPNVFGGATGAEVFVETVRRVISPDVALRRLGGSGARLDDGVRRNLLSECALRREEEEWVRTARGRAVGEIVNSGEPELASVLYALVCLEVMDVLIPASITEAPPAPVDDPLDEEAIRQRVRARLALVEDGDYFSILGVARDATNYEIRRAYLTLRKAFEPSNLLTAATVDLMTDVRLVIEVLDEAYEILREPHRRERYRRAIEAGPP